MPPLHMHQIPAEQATEMNEATLLLISIMTIIILIAGLAFELMNKNKEQE